MTNLYFDQFASDPELVLPYQEIGDQVVLAYDRASLAAGTMASVRGLTDEAGRSFLAIDCLNFDDEWFGLELALGERFKSATVEMKLYPGHQVYPKIYYDGGSLDLKTLQISQHVTQLKFSMLHFEQLGLPANAKNLRLSIMMPCCDWFVVGVYMVNVTHA